MNDTYNVLIKAIGKHFESFTLREYTRIMSSLNKVNIRHPDLIKAVYIQAISDGKEHKHDFTSFNTIVLPILSYLTNLNLKDTEAFKDIVFGDGVKKILRNEQTFQEKAVDEKTDSVRMLVSILEAGLDLQHSEFKTIVS